MKEIKVMIEGTSNPEELGNYLQIIGKYIPLLLPDGEWRIDNIGGPQEWRVIVVTKSINNAQEKTNKEKSGNSKEDRKDDCRDQDYEEWVQRKNK